MSDDSRVYNITQELEDIIKICLIIKRDRIKIKLTLLSSESILAEGSQKAFSILNILMKELSIHEVREVPDFYVFDEYVKSTYPRLDVYDAKTLLYESTTRIIFETLDYLEDLNDIYYISGDKDLDIKDFRLRWKQFYSSQISRTCPIEGYSYLWFILTKFGLKHRGEVNRIDNIYNVEILHDNPEFVSPFSIRAEDIKVLTLDNKITPREALSILYINRKHKGELFPIVGTRDILVKGGVQSVIIPTYRKYGFKKEDVDVFTTDSVKDLTVLETWSLIKIGHNNVCSIFDLFLYEHECKETKKVLTNPANRLPISLKLIKSIDEKVRDIQENVGKSYMVGFEPIALPKLEIYPLIYDHIKFCIAGRTLLTVSRSNENVITYLLMQSDRPENLFSPFGQRKLSLGYPFELIYLASDIRTIMNRHSNILGAFMNLFQEIDSIGF